MINFIFIYVISSLAYADSAMLKTQEFLNNPKEMSELASKDPKAKKAMDDVKSLSGGDTQLESSIYEISASIFGNFAGKSPEEMQKLLIEAQSDPKAFFEKLTPEQREAIKKAAARVPATNLKGSK